MSRPVGVGIIGAGSISSQYLGNLVSFPDIEVVVVADLIEQAAASRAAEFGVGESGDVDAVLGHPDVEIVVNLTIPAAHAAVTEAAIAAGKHVWSEKPISLDRATGQRLLALADAAGRRLGCAPDTFLGAGLQTARAMIERGDIGRPLTALTAFQDPGPDAWHPNPAFLFQEGAGPLLDMGPYYITALVQLFGSVRQVAAMGSRASESRTIRVGPREGDRFEVTVPTHVSALIEFESGSSSSSIFSFESPRPRAGFFEITGTEATLSLPDPNAFDGELRIWRPGADDWDPVARVGPTEGRGIGVLDMARAIRVGEPHRADGRLAYHVLDAMMAITDSAREGGFVGVESASTPSSLLPTGWSAQDQTL